MSDELNEQLSAFADDALDVSEHGLLLQRLRQDVGLRGRWTRYHLIGEVARSGDLTVSVDKGFAGRVAACLVDAPQESPGTTRWLRPVAGLAVAASVTAVALLSLRPDIQVPVDEPVVIVPVTANPQVPVGARVAAGPGIQWERAQPEVQAQLNQLLLEHNDEAVPADPEDKE